MKRRINVILSCLAGFAVAIFSCSESSHLPVMIDGTIERNEWADANATVVGQSNTLYSKTDQSYFYLAIASDLQKPIYVDLFIVIKDTVYNFHASSQLGDRVLTDTLWTDASPSTLWGRNKDWIANTVKFDRAKIRELNQNNFEGDVYLESFRSYDGFEFQFDKQTWDLRHSKLRIEIKPMTESNSSSKVTYPSNSVRMNAGNWHVLFD